MLISPKASRRGEVFRLCLRLGSLAEFPRVRPAFANRCAPLFPAPDSLMPIKPRISSRTLTQKLKMKFALNLARRISQAMGTYIESNFVLYYLAARQSIVRYTGVS